jgi:hypothetical protein
MEKKLGAILAVLAAAAVIFAGASRGVPVVETVVRAALAGAAGGLMGWLVFGKLGAALMRDAAGSRESEEGRKE